MTTALRDFVFRGCAAAGAFSGLVWALHHPYVEPASLRTGACARQGRSAVSALGTCLGHGLKGTMLAWIVPIGVGALLGSMLGFALARTIRTGRPTHSTPRRRRGSALRRGRLDPEASERRALRTQARAAVVESLRALGGKATRRAILQRAMADGGFTTRQLTSQASDSRSERGRGLVEHELGWALTKLKRDGLVENPERNVWSLAGAALENGRTAAVPLEEWRLVELRRMPYQLYLQTPEWRRTRAAALLRAGHCCSLDATHVADLEVHHRSYERLGEELDSDLTVLCRSCHELFHGTNGRPSGA